MARWFDLSLDPNDCRLLEMRQEAIAAARVRTTIPDRISYLKNIAAGREVLDVGIVEHFESAYKSPNWLHAHLAGVASRCLGVDVLEEGLKRLAHEGFRVLCHDLTSSPLSDSFDVAICGEVFEHLDAPAIFLRNLASSLKENGLIVITVPNPFYINVILRNTIEGPCFVDNVDHVQWFDPSTMVELAERAGLSLRRFVGISAASPRTWRGRLLFGLRRGLTAMGVRPEVFAKSIAYELVRQRGTPAEGV